MYTYRCIKIYICIYIHVHINISVRCLALPSITPRQGGLRSLAFFRSNIRTRIFPDWHKITQNTPKITKNNIVQNYNKTTKNEKNAHSSKCSKKNFWGW